MERERPSQRAYRPSDYALEGADYLPAFGQGLTQDEREAIILLYAARALAGLPLFQEQMHGDVQSGAA